MIASPELTFVTGTRPPESMTTTTIDSDSEALEELVLDEIASIDSKNYPDSLFADMTQRNVDRALKTMAGVAKREYLDKGISTLYLAVGALRWKDDSGDSRRSPLILLPASLESLGPRQPLYLAFSDDDISVNPALAIKLTEYGLELPSAELVIQAIENEGMANALDLFSALKLPDGWEVEDFATLSNFMFAKEAMYRDLLENEDLILNHEGLKSLAGDIRPEESTFAFDEVDFEDVDLAAPPESTPLILDADASQRAAVAAASAGKSFVMDGPPGTGKSQTIANMIGALISQGKTVLFVSEKIVALEVVRDRLAARGLDPFMLELHSHKAVRREVAKQLGQAVQMKPIAPARPAPERVERARATRENLSDYALAMNEPRLPLELSMFAVLGRIAALDSELSPPPSLLSLEALDPRSLMRISAEIDRLSGQWHRALEGDRALWAGLQQQPTSVFEFRTALDALRALQSLVPATEEAATKLGLLGLQSIEQLHRTLTTWRERPGDLPSTWLSANLAVISQSIEAYGRLLRNRQDAIIAAEHIAGNEWASLPEVDFDARGISPSWADLGVDKSGLAVAQLEPIIDYLRETNSLLRTTIESSRLLSTQLGLVQATGPATYQGLIDNAQIILGDAPPLSSWLSDVEARHRADEGLRELRTRVTAELEADEAASTVFTEAVLDLNLDGLAESIPPDAGLLKRLSRAYRQARTALLKTTQPAIDPKAGAAALTLAISWRDSRARLQESVALHATGLGAYFAGRETRWDHAAEAIRNAHAVANSGQVGNLATLTSVLASETTKDLLRPIHRELSNAFASWLEIDTKRGNGITPLAAARDIATTSEALQSLEVEARALLADLSLFTDHLGPEVTLTEATSAIAARHLADGAGQALLAAIPDVAEVLDYSVEDLPNSEEGLERLAEHLLWAREFRTLRAGSSSAPPLPLADIQALTEAYVPSALGEAIQAWETRHGAVLAMFDSSRQSELAADLADFRSADELLEEFVNDFDSAQESLALKQSLSTLQSEGLTVPLEYAVTTRVPASKVSDYLMKSIYETWFKSQMEADSRLKLSAAADRDNLIQQFRELDKELEDAAVSKIVEAASQRRPRSSMGQAGIILREAEKKRKHIPVRDLIGRARDVIQAVHPCFMMSPLAVSQYLPSDIKFDVVIFDEASQVSPGDAINCVYRGNAVITVGDQKQLPPTSFFSSSEDIDEDSDDENLASDYESILDLMKASGSFNSLTLRWHYRSRHEDLISYSNASFYEGRLITFPGAISDSERYGVKFHKVEGIYRRSAGRDNPIEAGYVAQRVLHHFDSRPDASLGVVAFSSAQRDTIENAITLARADRPDLDAHFQDDRLDGFFVKSLESVQGDERDVIIFSVGYGPDETGKFYRQFGPVNMAGGQRRLNVAVTRARELVELVTSISAADIGEVTSEGARHLRRYLDFAERGSAALALELGPSGLGTDSPFEDSVIDAIRSWGYEVQPQVGVAGYRIDIGVKHPNAPGAFMLGVECDGAMYHSSRTARDRDRLRHEILEGLGWSLHHIWGTAWYRNRAREQERLRELLELLASEPVSARVGKKRIAVPSAPLILEVEEDETDLIPGWADEYRESEPDPIPRWHDLGDHGGHRQLVGFVRTVVATEAPVHMDIVAQRLRAASGVGRLGARIQDNLKTAIARVGATYDGQFVRSASPHTISVRRPSARTERAIGQVPPEELVAAIIGVVRDARGISPEETAAHVAMIFGWRRQGATISGQLQALINRLCEDGVLMKTAAGLSVPTEAS